MNEVSVIKNEKLITKMEQLSLKELESYGTTIQSNIDSNCTNILNNVRVSDLGDTGEKLDELQSIANKQKRALSGPLKVFNLSRLTDRYTKAQDKIDNITLSIENQRDHLGTVIDNMILQSQNLTQTSKELAVCEQELNDYVNYLQELNDPDQIRLQVAAHRLKLITSSRVNAEQANVQALMIIKSNQESQYQLNEVVQNVIPILKMQAINAIGIKANRESIEIANKTKKITGELILKNANDIRDLATDLQNNRNSSPIDEEKLKQAQGILKNAIDIVTKASALEIENNLRVANDLANSAEVNKEYINLLSGK